MFLKDTIIRNFRDHHSRETPKTLPTRTFLTNSTQHGVSKVLLLFTTICKLLGRSSLGWTLFLESPRFCVGSSRVVVLFPCNWTCFQFVPEKQVKDKVRVRARTDVVLEFLLVFVHKALLRWSCYPTSTQCKWFPTIKLHGFLFGYVTISCSIFHCKIKRTNVKRSQVPPTRAYPLAWLLPSNHHPLSHQYSLRFKIKVTFGQKLR